MQDAQINQLQLSVRKDAAPPENVKKLGFGPSGRAVWIVVGKDNEHWVDPEGGFCTCKDYYFKSLSQDTECYHLRSVRKAMAEGQYVAMDFDDSEYCQMLNAVLEDQFQILGSS